MTARHDGTLAPGWWLTALLSTFLFLAAVPSLATEYRWKFVIPAMTDGTGALSVHETLEQFPGVRAIDIDLDRQAVRFTYDDNRAELECLRLALETRGFDVGEQTLLQEPGMGIMN